jgi:preprotein translocase subunit SecD
MPRVPRRWANLTRENVNQAIAIVLDGLVYSAPNVSEEIKGREAPPFPAISARPMQMTWPTS